MMKNLPVGLSDFPDFSKLGSIYVDKTAYIHRMLTSGGKTFFFSRPRRFGKSLFLSTIKALFEGKRALFKGLYIEDKFDWEPHPVVLLDMAKNAADITSLKNALAAHVRNQADLSDVDLDASDDPSVLLEQLILRAYLKTGKQVVVLIDEYDKPILDRMEDLEEANKMRETLYTFYGVLKASTPYLRLLVVTGITKISQTTIFSGFNNLNDISFDTQYAAICGYTQQELEDSFEDYIQQLSMMNDDSREQTMARIKFWYNGYSWDAAHFVYNPYSVLLLLNKGRYLPFWYTTGTPTFLLKLLKTKDTLEKILQEPVRMSETFTEGQRLESLNAFTLLFQAGYLTIGRFDRDAGNYYLQLPNEEVRRAISELVLMDLTEEDLPSLKDTGTNIREAFAEGDTAKAVGKLETLLANITYDTQRWNRNEGHYHALFQLVMILGGVDQQAEHHGSKGRADAVLRFDRRTYVVEIKHAPDTDGLPAALDTAMNQIHEKQYHRPFLNQGKTVHLLALAFTRGQVSYAEEIQ